MLKCFNFCDYKNVEKRIKCVFFLSVLVFENLNFSVNIYSNVTVKNVCNNKM